MDFKIYKNILRKPALWMASAMLLITLVGMVIILTINLSKNAMITLSSEFILNNVLLYFMVWISCLSRSTSKLLLNETIIKNEKEIVQGNNFQISLYTHFFISIIGIVIFFVELICYKQVNKISFSEASINSIALFIPLFVINIVFMYIFYLILVFLMNQDVELKNSSLKSYVQKVHMQVVEEQQVQVNEDEQE